MKRALLLLVLAFLYSPYDIVEAQDQIVLPQLSDVPSDKSQTASGGVAAPSPALTDDYGKKSDAEMINIVKSFEMGMGKNSGTVTRPSLRPSLEGKFGDWNLLSMKDHKGRKVFYMVAFPFNKIGNHDFVRRPYIMVMMDSYKRSYFIAAAGYYFYRSSPVSVSVSGEHFEIEAKDYIAITKTILDDGKIIRSMLGAERVMIYSRSSIGTYSVDVYSLRGFREGYKRMLEICL